MRGKPAVREKRSAQKRKPERARRSIARHAEAAAADAVRQRLDLRPFDEFAAEGGHAPGRTTRMLCAALAAVAEGKAVVVVADPAANRRRIQILATTACEALGLDRGKLRVLSRAEVEEGQIRGREESVFVDHYCPPGRP